MTRNDEDTTKGEAILNQIARETAPLEGGDEGQTLEGLTRDLERRVAAMEPLPTPDEADLGELARDPSDDGRCPECGTLLEPERAKPPRKGADWRCPKGCDRKGVW